MNDMSMVSREQGLICHSPLACCFNSPDTWPACLHTDCAPCCSLYPAVGFLAASGIEAWCCGCDDFLMVCFCLRRFCHSGRYTHLLLVLAAGVVVACCLLWVPKGGLESRREGNRGWGGAGEKWRVGLGQNKTRDACSVCLHLAPSLLPDTWQYQLQQKLFFFGSFLG